MKITNVFAACLASLMLLSSCTAPADETKSLYQHGLDVVALMDEMVNCDAYVQAQTGSAEILEITRSLAEGDYSSPKAVYRVTIPDETIDALGQIDLLSDTSENLRTFFRQKTLSVIPIQITATEGVNFLAAASLCTAGKTFVSDEIPGNVIYLYTYENTIPVAVTFSSDADSPGLVSASGTFLSHKNRSFETVEDVEYLFSEYAASVELIPANYE